MLSCVRTKVDLGVYYSQTSETISNGLEELIRGNPEGIRKIPGRYWMKARALFDDILAIQQADRGAGELPIYLLKAKDQTEHHTN